MTPTLLRYWRHGSLILVISFGALARPHTAFAKTHPKENVANLPAVSSKDGVAACALLANPGDFVLQTADMHNPDERLRDFRGTLAFLIHAKEVVSLHLPKIRFSHSEMISEISDDGDIVSWSFYPYLFRKNEDTEKKRAKFHRYDHNDESYRNDFSVYRMRTLSFANLVRRRERALTKVDTKDRYAGLGTCADFVDWAYHYSITSWWNFVPILRRVIDVVFPLEAILTPDDIAASPFTKKVCEVKNSELIFPTVVETQKLVRENRASLNSRDKRIVSHAKHLFQELTENQIIDGSGLVIEPRFRLKNQLAEQIRLIRDSRGQEN